MLMVLTSFFYSGTLVKLQNSLSLFKEGKRMHLQRLGLARRVGANKFCFLRVVYGYLMVASFQSQVWDPWTLGEPCPSHLGSCSSSFCLAYTILYEEVMAASSECSWIALTYVLRPMGSKDSAQDMLLYIVCLCTLSGSNLWISTSGSSSCWALWLVFVGLLMGLWINVMLVINRSDVS